MAGKLPTRLILASGSLGRRLLMEQAQYDFQVQPANVEEPTGAGVSDIRQFVHHVAWMKANAVATSIADGIVIAADTVGWIDGQVIGKPEDENDARRILRTLGGRKHELWTGVVLWRRPDNLQITWQECSAVFFKQLTDTELQTYLETRTWQGCSGAYAVKAENDPYVKILSGSLSNVVGLPMESLRQNLSLFV